MKDQVKDLVLEVDIGRHGARMVVEGEASSKIGGASVLSDAADDVSVCRSLLTSRSRLARALGLLAS